MQLKVPQNIPSTTTSSVSQEDPHPTNENYKTISGRAPARPPSGSGIDPRGGQPTGSFAALTPRAGARVREGPSRGRRHAGVADSTGTDERPRLAASVVEDPSASSERSSRCAA